MTDQVDRPYAQPLNEGGEIFSVLRLRELVSAAIPALWIVVAKTYSDESEAHGR
jgi:hypothetical protein